jgi:hypothetical protein
MVVDGIMAAVELILGMVVLVDGKTRGITTTLVLNMHNRLLPLTPGKTELGIRGREYKNA